LIESISELSVALNDAGSRLLVARGAPAAILSALTAAAGGGPGAVVVAQDEHDLASARAQEQVRKAVEAGGSKLELVWGDTTYHVDDMLPGIGNDDDDDDDDDFPLDSPCLTSLIHSLASLLSSHCYCVHSRSREHTHEQLPFPPPCLPQPCNKHEVGRASSSSSSSLTITNPPPSGLEGLPQARGAFGVVAERSGDPRWPIAPPGADGVRLTAGAWFEGGTTCRDVLDKAGVDVLTLDQAGEEMTLTGRRASSILN
jgi:hypothetical protein